MSETADVLVIGSGAGAAPIAFELSRAGFDLIVLEKGPRYSREDFAFDDIQSVTEPIPFVPDVRDEPHVLCHDGRRELTTLGWIACCVGGGTAHMGGSFYRFHPDDFRLRSRYGSFEAVDDWPYDYAELEPYYAKAEAAVGVSGRAGANPGEGYRSTPYPMPPLDAHWLAPKLGEACARVGLQAFPTPRAINAVPYGGRPACTSCDRCAGFGCPTGARGSVLETLLPCAEATGRCRVRTGTMVHTITVDGRGRATGCIYYGADGVERGIRAAVVCVSCSAVESARLLLHSRSRDFPDGLANRSGLVGRRLQLQASSFARARVAAAASRMHDRRALGCSAADHYFLPDGVARWPKGGTMQFFLERPRPVFDALKRALPNTARVLWGESLKRALRDYYRDSFELFAEIFHDFVPNAGTFVDLDDRVVDKWGLPVARLHLSPSDHHQVAGAWLADRVLDVFGALGALDPARGQIGGVNRVMTHGTCRAGADAATSVLNPFCQTHDVPNLFVVDGSFMPTSGGVPSTLTIIANSFRTADYIREQARRGELI
jgi:choline dehydrogenase-like flavoprotein